MQINKKDKVLHITLEDEPYPNADVLCGDLSKRQQGNKPFHPLDIQATKLPFKDKQFDVVLATHVLQAAEYPVELIHEIRRISKRALFKEYTDFAEMLMSWPNHKWVLSIEGNELVVKSKNPSKYGIFGPYFHHAYAEEPDFHNILKVNEWIMKISFDWYEEDDIYEEVEQDEVLDIDKELSDDKEVVKNNKTEMRLKNVVFRPTQKQYYDLDRFVVGEVEQISDIIK